MGRKSGFTLIELLITISLVAILTAVGVVSYTNFIKGSRDAKRVADLKAIQSSLEQFRVDRGFYPETFGMNTAIKERGAFTSETGAPVAPNISQKIYFNSTPQDMLYVNEQSENKYFYQGLKANQICSGSVLEACDNNSANEANWCSSYCLFGKLENPPSSISDCSTSGLLTYNCKFTPP